MQPPPLQLGLYDRSHAPLCSSSRCVTMTPLGANWVSMRQSGSLRSERNFSPEPLCATDALAYFVLVCEFGKQKMVAATFSISTRSLSQFLFEIFGTPLWCHSAQVSPFHTRGYELISTKTSWTWNWHPNHHSSHSVNSAPFEKFEKNLRRVITVISRFFV